MRKTQLITALDVDTEERALTTTTLLTGCSWVKVGLQLFVRSGPIIVEALSNMHKRVMLDLKFHDIPNTVEHAAAAAADLNAGFITVHASGGSAMIAAARKAVEGSQTRVLAVTVLTSMTETVLRDEVGIQESPASTVKRFAQMAVEEGAHGIVCSPHEIGVLRILLGDTPVIVTPGIRPSWAVHDDQARVMTPGQAAEAGADFIVVGRPILSHKEPALAIRSILDEIERAQQQ